MIWAPLIFFCHQSERSIFKKEKNFCSKSDQQKNPFWDPLPSSGLADIASAQGKRVICTRKICPKASVVVSSCIFYGFMQLINPRSTESLLPRKRKKKRHGQKNSLIWKTTSLTAMHFLKCLNKKSKNNNFFYNMNNIWPLDVALNQRAIFCDQKW